MSDSNYFQAKHHVKNFNKHAAVDLVRFSGVGVSRSDLATQLGLTRAGVTIIINDLISHGLIHETESRQTPNGRHPIILEVNPLCGFVASIVIGITHLQAAVGDMTSRIIDEVDIPFNIDRDPAQCIEEIHGELMKLLNRSKINVSNISAVGVAVPGAVNDITGMVETPANMKTWEHFPIREVLEKKLGVRVTLNNDAQMGALGEWTKGAARGEKDIAFIKIGSNIAAGYIINHQTYAGSNGGAGELGHITVTKNGPQCVCGHQGCLEAYAGGLAIAEQGRVLAREKKNSLLAQRPVETIGVEEVADAARRGDRDAQEILDRAGNFIGIAITALINLVNPSVVIIGGSVADAGDLLTNPIRNMVMEGSIRALKSGTRITTAVLGKRSILLGSLIAAASLSIHQKIDEHSPVFEMAAF